MQLTPGIEELLLDLVEIGFEQVDIQPAIHAFAPDSGGQELGRGISEQCDFNRRESGRNNL